MTTKIQLALAFGLFAALATPAAAAVAVENNPVNSGRYVAGIPGPVIGSTWMAMAQSSATKRTPVRVDRTWEWRQFDRALGDIH